MKMIKPTLELLRAYVYDALPPEEEHGVRAWLVATTQDELLDVYEALLREREQRQERLSYWTARPLRARINRLWQKARRRLSHELLFDEASSQPTSVGLARLGFSPGASPGDLLFEVKPGHPVDILIHVAEPAYLEVYAVEANGHMRRLWESERQLPAGFKVEAGGFSLDASDEPVEIYAVFYKDLPSSGMGPEADASLLCALLSRAAETTEISVLRGIVTVAPEPDPGKQI